MAISGWNRLGMGIGAGLTTFGQLMMEKRLREEQAAAEEARRRQEFEDAKALAEYRADLQVKTNDRLDPIVAQVRVPNSTPTITGMISQGAMANPLGPGFVPNMVPKVDYPTIPVRASSAFSNKQLFPDPVVPAAGPWNMFSETLQDGSTRTGLVRGKGTPAQEYKDVNYHYPSASGSGSASEDRLRQQGVHNYLVEAIGGSESVDVTGSYKTNDKGDRVFDPYAKTFLVDRKGRFMDLPTQFGGLADEVGGMLVAVGDSIASENPDMSPNEVFRETMSVAAPAMNAAVRRNAGVEDVYKQLESAGFYSVDSDGKRAKSITFGEGYKLKHDSGKILGFINKPDEVYTEEMIKTWLAARENSGAIETQAYLDFLENEVGVTNIEGYVAGVEPPRVDPQKKQENLDKTQREFTGDY